MIFCGGNMSVLDNILTRRDQLRMSLDDWDRYNSFPRPTSESLLAIEYFRSIDTPFEIIEVIASEAISSNHTSNEFVLSMLVQSASHSPLEVDFGHGKFLRGNAPGLFVFGDLRQPHSLQGIGPFNSIQLSLDVDVLQDRIRELTGHTNISLDRLHAQAFEDDILKAMVGQLMGLCRSGYHREQTAGPSRVDKALDQIGIRLANLAKLDVPELTDSDKLQPISIRRVLEYIHTYFDQKLSRNQLAAIAQVTPSHFSRLFHSSVGVAPKQYILRLRIREARRLLKDCPDLAITDISQRLGFIDTPHFSREFQRQTGVSPAAYRRHV
ncbi:AraC family transcriptional regulator [Bremerella cremea]|uniref:HTH araC/xylS-type domain-containing protein n=1 Tax=Blastopirellula marina TaxID=124 RepID=A0A2S8FZH8_9BACT|nr:MULTISPECIES: AraC family transcriptional regulator [Pirellulaceae]PQO37599.1 hypothetical protein C5Y83_06545 [Blastopirellula marina]RCS49986.1 AraC family transcriptional regulator [Bremerella cremea]